MKGGTIRGSQLPVPGTLRRVSVDERDLADTLERQFSLPRNETRAYLLLLEAGDPTQDRIAETLGININEAKELFGRMKSRGLIIDSPTGASRYAPLHPRMSMTNLFKVFEQDLVQSLRDRRATVDRVVNLLTPIFEERKR